MKTVRLTMAQALVRYLDQPEDRDRRGRRPPLPRRLRDLRARQRHLPFRSAGGGEGRVPDLARAERAVDGARRGRLRQGQAPPADHGGAFLHRPGRRQHGDRRRLRDGEPAADPDPRRRRLRQPPARPGAAAGRAFRQSDDDGERRLPRGDALLGPHHASRADHLLAAAGGRDDARSRPIAGPAFLGLCQDTQELAFDYPESFFEPRIHHIRRQRPDRGEIAPRRGAPEEGEEAARHRRRRRALLARRGGADRLRREARPAGRRDDRRPRLAGARPQEQCRPDRRDRRGLGECACRRRRRDRRDRHAAAGLHHRLVVGVRARCALHRHQRRPLRRHQAPRALRRRRCARGDRRARRRARRVEGRQGLDAARGEGICRLERHGGEGDEADQHRACRAMRRWSAR